MDTIDGAHIPHYGDGYVEFYKASLTMLRLRQRSLQMHGAESFGLQQPDYSYKSGVASWPSELPSIIFKKLRRINYTSAKHQRSSPEIYQPSSTARDIYHGAKYGSRCRSKCIAGGTRLRTSSRLSSHVRGCLSRDCDCNVRPEPKPSLGS
jgi:hypothetical protein